MKTVRTCLLIGGLVALIAGVAVAQDQEPVAVLEYYDDDFEIVVRDADGFEYSFYLGMELVPGDTIETFNSTAEVRLVPNGSIVKVGTNTEFTIDELQGRDGGSTNGFSVAAGRIRNVAASVAGSNYEVRTPSTVAGVRGTDFGVEVSADLDGVAVLEGSVEVTKRDTGESVTLGANQYANALADTFQAIELSADQIRDLFDDFDFEELDPAEVPTDQTTQAEETPDDDDGVQDAAPPAEVPQQPSPEDAAEGDGAGEDSALQQAVARAAEVLGMEIGSVTLEGDTYAKLVFQPEIQLGRLRASLYLPFIYQRDLFDPDDWYKPKGNNEWNFGFGDEFSWEDEPLDAAQDFLTDLALKFRFIEFGRQRDPFFIKLGNLNNMVLGHGVLVDNYANDIDFPAIRRVGINGGVTLGRFGLEYLVNDLAEPEVFGLRPWIKPFGADRRLALGISGVMDIDPAGDLPPTPEADPDTGDIPADLFADARDADPIMAHVAGDVDLPIIERDAFSIILFSDFGTLFPQIRNTVTTTTTDEPVEIAAGWKQEAAFDQSEEGLFETYASMSGVMGTLFGVDYRLDFRSYKGFITPGFYDSNYDRRRGDYAAGLIEYLADPDDPAYEDETLGIYGEAGFGLFNDRLTFSAGYMWPFGRDQAGNIVGTDEDFLKMELFVARDLTPLEIQGSFAYERTAFIPTLLAEEGFEEASLFDSNTVLSGELIYPVAPTLNIAVVAKTVMIRNDDGTVKYSEEGRPVVGPSFSVETRLGF
ncbi:MAG: FecR domain-containing protein [Spirochaetaceae bacterium]